MNWNFRAKLGLIVGITVAALFGLVLLADLTNKELFAAMDVRRHTQEVRIALERLNARVREAEAAQRGFLITGDETYLTPYTIAAKDLPALLASLREQTSDNPGQQQHLSSLDRLIPDKLATMQSAIDLRRAKGAESAMDVVRGDRGFKIMEDIVKVISDMQAEEEQLFTTRSNAAKAMQTRARWVITVGASGVILLLLIGGWMLSRTFAQPIDVLMQAAQRIAGGELGGEIGDTARGDEVGLLTRSFVRMSRTLQAFSLHAKAIAAGDLTREPKPQSERDELGNAFSTMTRNLRGMMRDLVEIISVLTSTASQIRASTSEVAASVAQTASAVTETTATVEEVKQTAQLSREKGRLVADSAQQVTEVAQRGRGAVEDTIQGMRRIREQMDSIGASMLRLSEQTQAISEIIATVNDLAEQSNILAVNAAIEAAKAGEHGRGFSVVAQEVRSLAEQSKQATSQVRTILSDIQKATTGAMLATEEGSKAVDAGLQQANESGSSISALTENLAQATQAAVQIAASSQQQSTGMDQIAIAIRNIQEAATQNASAVKQVEDAARDLHELGEKLRGMADQYKI